MHGTRTPRVTRAIYACACDDVGALGEIYKHETHTHLWVVREILLYILASYRWVSAGTRLLSLSFSFSFSFSLSLAWWNLHDLCCADSLRFSSWAVSRTLDLTRHDTKASFFVALVSMEIDKKHIRYVRPWLIKLCLNLWIVSFVDVLNSRCNLRKS